MNVRSAAPSLIAVLLTAVIAACGGPPASPGGTGGTGGNPTRPPAGGPLSGHMPAELAGQPMTYTDATGEEAASLLETADAELIAESMDAVSKPMTALEVTVGQHPSGVVGALSVDRLHWTPGSSSLARLVTGLVGPTERMRVTSRTVAGKRLLHIRDFANDEYEAFAYISGQRDTDIVYFARGDDELVEAFYSSIR